MPLPYHIIIERFHMAEVSSAVFSTGLTINKTEKNRKSDGYA